MLLAACAGGDDGKGSDSGLADSDLADSDSDSDTDGPTWHQDVAPVVAEKCGSCHTADGVAPFVLDEYAGASQFASAMIDAIESGRMPPWFAIETDECDPMLPFEGDLRLSDDELATLKTWFEDGAPEGDPATAAELPESPSLFIANPDKELEFPEQVEIEGEDDQFICFVLDPGIDEMKWVTEIQLAPDNDKIDHHALITQDVYGATADGPEVFDCFNTPSVDGFLMATWTPGAVPMKTPETAAMPLYPDARIIVQMHYHPSKDGAEFDRSKVQIVWQDEQPVWAAAQALVGNNSRQSSDGTGLQPGPNDTEEGVAEFRIPAGATNHTETIYYTQSFPLELPIFSVGTHMHYVGTDMKIDYIPAGEDGEPESEECMIQTPWDFDWQRVYSFDVPIDQLPTMAQGDSLRMRYTYDNTMDNPGVARSLEEAGLTEPADVVLGEETLDEMCLGLFGILIPPAMVDQLF